MERIVWTIALFAAASYGWAQSPKKLASRAHTAYTAENFALADSLYGQCLLTAPDDAVYQFNAGTAAYRNNRYDSALVYFERAMVLADTLAASAHYNRGNCHMMRWLTTDLELDYVKSLIDDMSSAEGLTIEQRLNQFLAKDSLMVERDELLVTKEGALESAIVAFRSAMLVDPLHDKARYNFLFAKGKRPGEAPPPAQDPDDSNDDGSGDNGKLEEIRKKGFDLIRDGKFEAAYRYLSQERQRDETLTGLDPILEKLGVILQILNDA